MQEIYFVTGNPMKYEEVRNWLNELNPSIELKQVDIDLPEIQSLNIEEVALEKAKCAWLLLKKPILIDDGGIYIDKYNDFPGTLSKFVYQGIGLEGLWLLAKDNPKSHFRNCLVYIDNENAYHIFNGVSEGKMIEPNKDIPESKMPFTYVFIPNGSDKTFSQIESKEEQKQFHHRYKSVNLFSKWLKSR